MFVRDMMFAQSAYAAVDFWGLATLSGRPLRLPMILVQLRPNPRAKIHCRNLPESAQVVGIVKPKLDGRGAGYFGLVALVGGTVGIASIRHHPAPLFGNYESRIPNTRDASSLKKTRAKSLHIRSTCKSFYRPVVLFSSVHFNIVRLNGINSAI